MDLIIVVTYILPLVCLTCGGYLVWWGISSKPDRLWQKHVARQQSNGLNPMRTTEWDQSLQFARIRSIIAGCILVICGLVIVWIGWINGLY
jgi:hypothetical protein